MIIKIKKTYNPKLKEGEILSVRSHIGLKLIQDGFAELISSKSEKSPQNKITK